jgi:class 3 adenylate cyclase
MEQPETRYARSGEVHIAYQVTGDGPYDLVHAPGFISNVELAWQVPSHAAFIRRLSSSCRLIRFDKRGTGMSDRTGVASLETRMDDVRAVMDDAGSQRAALLGVSEGGPMSLLFAATYPARVWALALWSTFPRVSWAPHYPFGDTLAELERGIAEELQDWHNVEHLRERARAYMPESDKVDQEAFATALRHSASPGAVEALYRMNLEIDVTAILPTIRQPTLAFVRAGDNPENVAGTRYIAEHIPRATYVELEGGGHPMFVGESEAAVGVLEGFLRETWHDVETEAAEPETVLATVLFTDIVDSTVRMAALGDRAWRGLIESHHAEVRRQLNRFRGLEIDTAGDGFFARFDGPARAIRCAQAISESVGALGIEVRAGLHTGECEVADGKVAGIAVVIGARVASEASAGEVLVSSTVRDLVAGSDLRFDDRGVRPLKGVPGDWRLFAVAQ